jgi:hypothetical protein
VLDGECGLGDEFMIVGFDHGVRLESAFSGELGIIIGR